MAFEVAKDFLDTTKSYGLQGGEGFYLNMTEAYGLQGRGGF